MQRVTIVERHSGCPLYDYIKLWKEDERNPSTPAKIIHLFAHIAKTLKEDQVTRVIFEPAVDSVKKPKKKHNYNYNSHRYGGGLGASAHATASRHGNSSNPLMLAYRQPTLQSVRTRSLEMWCCVTPTIVVALFVSPEHFKEDPRLAVQEVAMRFEEAYAQQLTELAPQFTQMTHDTEQARNDHSFLPTFAAFKMGLAAEEQDDTNSRMTSPLPQQPTVTHPLLLSIDLEDNRFPRDTGEERKPEDYDALDIVLQETKGDLLIERLLQGSTVAVGDTELDDEIILATVKRPAANAVQRTSRQDRAQSAVTIRDETPTMLSDVALTFANDDDDDIPPEQFMRSHTRTRFLRNDMISSPEPTILTSLDDIAQPGASSIHPHQHAFMEDDQDTYDEFDNLSRSPSTLTHGFRSASPLVDGNANSQSQMSTSTHRVSESTSFSGFDD